MPTLNLTLPDDAIKFVRDRIGIGQFADESEVVYEAIRQMDDKAYQAKLQDLREALAEGVRQVHAGEVEEFSLQELIAELNAKQ